MNLDLPKITTRSRPFAEKDADKVDELLLLVPGGVPGGTHPWRASLLAAVRRAGHKRCGHEPVAFALANARTTHIAAHAPDQARSTFERLCDARRLVAIIEAGRPERVTIACAVGQDHPDGGAQALDHTLSALLAASFPLPSRKSHPGPRWRLQAIDILGAPRGYDPARAIALARGNNLARFLTALPPNELQPGTFRRIAQALAKETGLQARFFDEGALKRLGAGAFLAVSRGSSRRDAGILRLSYRPATRSDRGKKPVRPIALVGKGICFDTGGTNLKTARHMHGMHEDMAGAAVALGLLLAARELNLPVPIDCWLALSENAIGPGAYRQNEVVRAANGTSIEIMHTDAEGRMVLADALWLASGGAGGGRSIPRLIVDFATLTGACVQALSTRMSGAFTNRPELISDILRAGNTSGERVAVFPVEPDFDEALKSDIADVKQCLLENEADHILAASFLGRFVKGDIPWVHVDLASANHKGGLAHVPTAVTGFGVRLGLALIEGLVSKRPHGLG